MTFMEKLRHAAQVNRSLICVGLDPELAKLPECVRQKEHALFEFNRQLSEEIDYYDKLGTLDL